MKKIVIDARIINTSTGRYIERLLTCLQDIDTTNHYTVLVKKKDVMYWVPKNKNFVVQVADYDNFSFNEQLGFAWFLYKQKPDLVHFCMPQQPILYFKKSITTVHDLTLLKTYNTDKNWLIYHLKQLVGRFVFWWIMHKSVKIIVPTDYTREEIIKRYKLNKNKLIKTHLAADINDRKAKKRSLPFKKYLLYVGQQSDYKNVRCLIRAHQKLLDKHPDLGLVFVGKKDTLTSRNEKWVQENTYKNIVFTGFVDDAELSYLYKNSLVYVFPSLMEGFGLPGLEAMAHGAPVASSNATCLPEVYGEAAHYFDPMSVEDMSQKINEIITRQKLRDKLITLGYQQVKKYSWATMAEQTHSVYLAALERNDRS